ncbi:MAG TPA: hypothetical protein VK610_03010, partial [Rhodothermales bacterium]|nr:hypothetical protein [Rhodothermales bacterium]
MNANEVIDSYVEDVTKRLPRKQRDDVAFELRELLDEGLQAQADAAGRSPDAEMATAFARAFGHPRDVAARYRAPLHIVDPADAHLFVRSTVVGMAVIWGLGLVLHLSRPIASGSDLLVALGAWWGNTVLGSLWWPGALVVGFGLAAWGRRRRPR